MSNKFDELNRAIELDPENAEAYKNRGNAYFREQEFDKALKDFDKAIGLDKDYYQAINNRGLVYRKKGLLNEALSDLSRTLEIKPDFALAYYNRGLVYKDLNEPEKAIKDYTSALELNPEYHDASLSRLDLFVESGFFEKSVQNYIDESEQLDTGDMYVQLPKVLVESPYKYDCQAALEDWVNAAKARGIIGNLPFNIMMAYGVFIYWTQIKNGGITQFVYNTGWSPVYVFSTQQGLENMKAPLNHKLFNKVAEYIDGLGSEFETYLQMDYSSYAEKMKYLRELTDEYYDIQDEESVEELNYEFISSFDNVDMVDDLSEFLKK